MKCIGFPRGLDPLVKLLPILYTSSLRGTFHIDGLVKVLGTGPFSPTPLRPISDTIYRQPHTHTHTYLVPRDHGQEISGSLRSTWPDLLAGLSVPNIELSGRNHDDLRFLEGYHTRSTDGGGGRGSHLFFNTDIFFFILFPFFIVWIFWVLLFFFFFIIVQG